MSRRKVGKPRTSQSSKRKKKSKDDSEERRRPGNQGGFFKSRLRFLQDRLETYYVEADEGRTKAFFLKVLAEYWKEFNWRLSRDEEPVSGTQYPETDDESELPEKNKIVEATNEVYTYSSLPSYPVLHCSQSIRGWFRYRQHRRIKDMKNPWTSILKHLTEEAAAVSPRALPGWQYYMSVESAAVSEEYSERHPDVSKAVRTRDIAGLCKVARELFDKLPEDEQAGYEAAAKELHQKEYAAYKAEREKNAQPRLPEDIQM